jgi:hypothetical protein
MDEGLEAHQALMHSGVSHDKRSMEIGWYGRVVKNRNEFHRHGCKDENEYRQMVRVGRTTWYRMIRIAGALSQLKKEEFLSMTAENADQLSRLSEEDRYEPEILEAARTKTETELARYLLERQAKAENKPVEDVRVTMKFSVFEGQRTVIDDRLKDFMREYAIADRGTALEWWAMEYGTGESTMAFQRQSVPALRKALKAETLEEIKTAVGEYVISMVGHLDRMQGKRR